MRIRYIGCFKENDRAEEPLKGYLQELACENGVDLETAEVTDVPSLWSHLSSLSFEGLDVLIIGGHGHNSLTGYCVGADTVRWHELSSKLTQKLPKSCSFIFYSCNGAYPGIGHVFDGAWGPDFIFGPYNHVDAAAMTHATRQIVSWKSQGKNSPEQARKLVEAVNEWAKSTYRKKYDHSFLRVQWREGHEIRRYPEKQGQDRPTLPPIPMKGSK